MRAAQRVLTMITALALLAGACDWYSDGAGTAEEAQAQLSPRFDWAMPPRYLHDANQNGFIDLPNTSQHALNLPADTTCPSQGCSGVEPLFSVTLDATSSTLPEGTETVEYRWRLDGANLEEPRRSSSDDPSWSLDLPEGNYTVDLEVTVTSADWSIIGTSSEAISIDDILVLAAGDSFASGEGAPEASDLLPNLVVIGIGDDEAAGAGGTRQDVRWADSGSGTPTVTTHYSFESVVPQGPAYVVQAFGGDAVSRDHARTHRSTSAPGAKAAAILERRDPRTSVTFLSVAASGAGIRAGLLDSFDGPPPVVVDGPALPPQLEHAAALLGCWNDTQQAYTASACGRSVDLVVLSIGYYDFGLPNVHQALLARGSDVFDNIEEARVTLADVEEALATGDWGPLAATFDAVTAVMGGPLPPLVTSSLSQLGDDLDSLARAITGTLRVDQLLLVPYPSPLLHGDGLCQEALADVSPLGELDADEIAWLQENVYDPLNGVLAHAAADHDWLFVDSLNPGFPNGNGVCAPVPYQLDVTVGRPYPPPIPEDGQEELAWFMSAAESASVVGGSKSGSTATFHPNELGRGAIAAAIAATVS